MNAEQLAEYKRYIEMLSSNASIEQTINFEKEYALKMQKIKIAKETAIEFAKVMLTTGETDEKISQYTKLTQAEIELLRVEIGL